ncbi:MULTISPECIES: dTMP kinase [unclassified Rathayibacter]|uniref:dTMP kinase n=1 Tax=unclassified Rathayibacter TaxID=2609250 RepID=UPI00188CBA81|nr:MULTISPECIES: dTMP kinase [unclassified Rathayibacter]MBF4462858.1 dTMP kinase [Rathayibacter sp. VKM Ac-2879]MBF4504272.1 dTMP kinase [Rathayibacter sp. VKM Ac-2878]
MTGLFVTLEGGDGAGKTTQAQLLEEWLVGRGERVLRTREPGGTEVGVQIREIVLHHRGEVDPRAEALLYAADRAQHIGTLVRPALERGEVVIQDRYIDSSVAYQGAGRVLDAAEVRTLSEWATHELRPDLTVLLDLDPTAARSRLVAAQKRFDRLEAEKAEFHERVRAGFLQIAAEDQERVLVLDASAAIDDIATAIRARVAELLDHGRPVGGRG